MVTICMKTTLAGPNGVIQSGQTVEIDETTARALVDGNYATLIAGDFSLPEPVTPVETAVLEPAEQAVIRRGRKAK